MITFRRALGINAAHGVPSVLNATYAQLCRAFNDGTFAPRNVAVSMARWVVTTPDGEVEIYDDRVGTCYAPDGLERCEITTWMVRADTSAAIATALERLGNANPKSPRDFG